MQNNKVHAPGKVLIIVISILYIILGLINALAAFSFLVDFRALIVGAWYIYMGGMGVTYCGDLSKAKLLHNIAKIAISIHVIIIIINVFFFLTFMISTELVLSILYLIGVDENVKAYTEKSHTAQSWHVPPAQIKRTNTPPTPSPEANPPIKRAFRLLEEGDWDKADVLFEQALKENPENPYAYIGKLCVELRLKKEEDLLGCESLIADNVNYKRALLFADKSYRQKIEMYALTPSEQEAEKEAVYQKILNNIEAVKDSKDHLELAEIKFELTGLGDYKDAKQILKTLTPINKGSVISCKNCDRKNASIRTTCLDCGAELD